MILKAPDALSAQFLAAGTSYYVGTFFTLRCLSDLKYLFYWLQGCRNRWRRLQGLNLVSIYKPGKTNELLGTSVGSWVLLGLMGAPGVMLGIPKGYLTALCKKRFQLHQPLRTDRNKRRIHTWKKIRLWIFLKYNDFFFVCGAYIWL